jgi:nucleoside-diphosphate-sugar epimerase
MAAVVCFGLGYSARHWAAEFGHPFGRIVGTVRSPQRAAAPVVSPPGATAVETVVFDGVTPTPELRTHLDEASVVLVSAPPGAAGDPVLAAFGGALPARRLGLVVYLSTVGVYGDHAGGVVDEATAPRPASPRSKARLAAELAWQRLGGQARVAVAVLRLAGIYGPGQNALVSLQQGRARRIVKPGQAFNRIHVADIGQAIAAAIARKANGIFNVADDEPSPPQDVIAFAARLLGIAPPPEIPFAEAAHGMSPMALSFYDENKRVLNRKLKAELGVHLRYPTYREGLRALHAKMSAGGR